MSVPISRILECLYEMENIERQSEKCKECQPGLMCSSHHYEFRDMWARVKRNLAVHSNMIDINLQKVGAEDTE
jgi:hypothetical protein